MSISGKRHRQAAFFVVGEIGQDVAIDDADEVADVRHVVELVVAQFGDRDLQNLLLALDPARIATCVMSEAAVRDGLLAVHVREPGLEMDVQMAPRVVVVHLVGDRDVDPADGIDQFLRRVDLQRDVPIEVVVGSNRRQSEKRPDDLVGELLAADRVGGVDLVLMSAGESDERIARHREDVDRARYQIERSNHDRIRARTFGKRLILVVVVIVDPHDEHVEPVLAEQIERIGDKETQRGVSNVLVIARHAIVHAEREDAASGAKHHQYAQDDRREEREGAPRLGLGFGRHMLTQALRAPVPVCHKNRTKSSLQGSLA